MSSKKNVQSSTTTKLRVVLDVWLNTATYGTSLASFLATNALKQLKEDNSDKFPEALAVLESYSYVDDLLSGADTLDAAKKLQKDLIIILSSEGLLKNDKKEGKKENTTVLKLFNNIFFK